MCLPKCSIALPICLGLLLVACDSKARRSAATIQSPWAALAKGKVDIEGGLINLAASREGLITSVLVEEGAEVAKGQLLATLDDRPSRLALALAERETGQTLSLRPALALRLEAAQREEARLRDLVPKEGASVQELDLARDARGLLEAELKAQDAAVATARARVDQARYEVEQRLVRAPLAGRIVRRMARPGDGVSTLNVTPLFQFAPDQPKIIRAELDEAYLSQVSVGQSAQIALEADEHRVVLGRVLRLGRVVGAKLAVSDPSERTDTRVVECVLSLESTDFLIGQRVIVRFMGKEGVQR